MLDAPLTTGAVTDIEGRVGGAVGAGRSSHATVSITTARESRTVRLTTHLRAMGGRIAATGGAMDTPGWPTQQRPAIERRGWLHTTAAMCKAGHFLAPVGADRRPFLDGGQGVVPKSEQQR